VHNVIAVSQDKTLKNVGELKHKVVVVENKQDEVEKVIPLVVKAKIGEMMKLHLEDMDQRKLAVEVFQYAIKGKADTNQVKDVRKQMDSYHNTFDLMIAEVKAKLDHLNRD
jgi:hypothetical protein